MRSSWEADGWPRTALAPSWGGLVPSWTVLDRPWSPSGCAQIDQNMTRQGQALRSHKRIKIVDASFTQSGKASRQLVPEPVKCRGSFTGSLISSRHFNRILHIVEVVRSITSLAGAQGMCWGRGGSTILGSRLPSLTLARGYQDLQIQDHILNLHLL